VGLGQVFRPGHVDWGLPLRFLRLGCEVREIARGHELWSDLLRFWRIEMVHPLAQSLVLQEIQTGGEEFVVPIDRQGEGLVLGQLVCGGFGDWKSASWRGRSEPGDCLVL
jgi:hypothetical protein